MKKCFNCDAVNKKADIYCRRCGYIMKKNSYFILVNIGIIIASLTLIFILALFAASYYIY